MKWIKERSVKDKIIIDNKTYEREILYDYEKNLFKIIWRIYEKGKKIITDNVMFSKLEQIYQTNKDR